MLDREDVKEFLRDQFTDLKMEVPEDLDADSLADAFCKYTEDDYYEWLRDNFKSFFNHGDPDWVHIREKIAQYARG